MSQPKGADAKRVEALRSYHVLDTPPDEIFDALTRLAASVFDVDISLVSLVDTDRQWFKSRFGLDARETPREHAFCGHAIRGKELFVVPDAHSDPRFADNPLVTGEPYIRFYAGCPVFSPDGHGLGTLCIIDLEPRQLTENQLAALEGLGRIAATALEAHRKVALLERSQRNLESRQRQKEILASMVVHDLRNPLAAIMALASSELHFAPADTKPTLENILMAANRIQRMALDVLDLCLADAAELRLRTTELALVPFVQTQVDLLERVSSAAGCRIATRAGNAGTVAADPQLLERVVANLLENAIRHSPPDTQIEVTVAVGADTAELAVADHGHGIPEADRERVFDPYVRGANDADHPTGYGLGLAFCKMAVEAHGGRIQVGENEPHGSIFRIELPVAQATTTQPT